MKMRLKHISRIGVLVCVLGVFTSSAQNLPPASADADIRILLDEQRYVFDDHAAATHTWRTVYQLLTPAAVRNAMVEVAWEPWHEQRPTIKASVITKDGKRHDLDQATIGDAPAPTNMPDIFTDRRILQAPLPAVDVGAVVEEEIVSRETAPSFDRGVIHFMQFTRTGAPVDRARLIIEHTASTPIHYASRSLSNIEPRRTETRGHTQLVFEAGPFEALKPLNPFVAPDQGLPSFVMFTTGSSWKDVASRYSEIVDQQIGRSDVSALVRGLAGKSRLEIAAELLSRLQREVRYTGVEYGDASFVPRPPEETLRRKYGDCKDKAALLVAMLRQSGIPAYIALLTVNPEFDALPELPGMGWFSHAIVYVPGAPDLWIDPTFEFGRAGQLHAGEQGRLALIARPESDGLIRTPESSSSDNTSVETREIYLPESGAARVVETTELSGALEQELRAYYASSGTDGVRAQLEKYVKSYYQAAELSALDVPSPNDLEHSFRMRLEARNSGIGRAGADDAVVVIPQAQLVDRFSGFIESFDADSKWTMRDAQDVIIPDPFVTEWRYRIVPPPGFGARLSHRQRQNVWARRSSQQVSQPEQTVR